MMKSIRQAMVLGLGVSGTAAAMLLRREGAEVVAVDAADSPAIRARMQPLHEAGIRVCLGISALPDGTPDVAVVSPGVPADSPWLAELHRRDVDVLPEFELGWRRRGRARVLAVTGSVGKSTLVKWLSESLLEAGHRAAPAGNYGPAVSCVVSEDPDLDWLVLELSSFQLELARAFRADIAILLNLYAHHLDRHRDLETYAAAKAQLFAHARKEDVGIVPVSWLDRRMRDAGGCGRWLTFGPESAADFRVESGRVWRGGGQLVDLRGTYFDNDVLGPAAAAAAAALTAVNVEPAALERAARAFRPLPHRMEWIADVEGVRFINDSKATSLEALAAGLKQAGRPVRLLAGGLWKKSELGSVKDILAKHARGVYGFGQAGVAMCGAWAGTVPCRECGTLVEAARQARLDAQPGEVILLSPGCASFDQFENFEERGRCFVAWVQNLQGRNG